MRRPLNHTRRSLLVLAAMAISLLFAGCGQNPHASSVDAQTPTRVTPSKALGEVQYFVTPNGSPIPNVIAAYLGSVNHGGSVTIHYRIYYEPHGVKKVVAVAKNRTFQWVVSGRNVIPIDRNAQAIMQDMPPKY